jgi:hypothetical protein
VLVGYERSPCWLHLLTKRRYPTATLHGVTDKKKKKKKKKNSNSGLSYARNIFESRTIHKVLGYGLDDRGSRVRFPAGAGNFSLHHHVQNGSGAHLASYPMGTRGSFPGGNVAGA